MRLNLNPARACMLILCLSACSKHADAPALPQGRAHFFKEDGSDKQMTRDLNACAYQAFKYSADNDDAPVKSRDVVTQQSCMQGKGYEIFYH